VGYASVGIERDAEYFELARSAIPKLAALPIWPEGKDADADRQAR
jgi:hypothetical protein